MAPSTTAAEADVRSFARTYGHLPNVRRMIALCEAQAITWDEAVTVARGALAAGLGAVTGAAR